MARIALIGGHGKVALLTTPALVGEGHTVDSIVRNPDHVEEVAALGRPRSSPTWNTSTSPGLRRSSPDTTW